MGVVEVVVVVVEEMVRAAAAAGGPALQEAPGVGGARGGECEGQREVWGERLRPLHITPPCSQHKCDFLVT